MKQEQKGRIRNKEIIRERLLLENTRRMLLAALISIVLFCAGWIAFLVKEGKTGSIWQNWLIFGAFLLIEVAVMAVSFWVLAGRRIEYAFACVSTYWIVEGILLGVATFFGKGMLMFRIHFVLMLILLSVIPILTQRCQIAVLVYELLLILVYFLRGNLEPEDLLFCVVIVALCYIIAAQGFAAFYRRVSDASIIHSAKSQAETDPMTKMFNRRGLERRIGYVWPLCKRQKLEAAVIMMDIDNFKKYNDAYGHAAGDECIKAVARVIRNNTRRTTDYAARVGGEEFLVFLTGIRVEETIRWAQKCKNDVEKLQIRHAKDNPLPFVSLSMGICHVIPADGQKEFWEARNEADRSLYQAKEAGRACIFMDNKMYAKTYPEPKIIRR
ncbi:MAG: diguanylate cyclase [Lachnospiraceae bacterium]